jgi:DNA-binding CsgD family transcriptional regulator
MSLTTSAVTAAATVAARPSWAEERRLDRAERARLDRERDDATAARRIAEREAAQRLRQAADAARAAKRAEAAEARAARLAALGAWIAGHVTELLFVPVIAVPALLAWTAMASYGAHLYGTPGRALPAFSEGAMWAFAAAVTITRHRHPGRPVWHLRAGTVVFAAFGAALNFAHGLTLGGPVTGAVMALVSVAGVTAHQLTTAGPRRPRRTLAERDAAKLARQIRRREIKARTEAVKAATVQLAADGTTRLTFAAEASPAAEHDASASDARDASPKRAPRPAAEGKRAPAADTETRIARLRAKHPELTGPQIADRLGISARTVRRYPAPQTSA